ncbi:MAG: CBS domain-containing protein [Deltaproteobacteria bacterium]|nr:CBS domain-containing protein [Deltaproteobacteria bacterium]
MIRRPQGRRIAAKLRWPHYRDVAHGLPMRGSPAVVSLVAGPFLRVHEGASPMAVAVAEIMNHEVFSVRTGDRVELVLRHLVALGITGAPVLDADDVTIGFVSLRALLDARAGNSVAAYMSVPPACIDEGASIREVAERMAESSRHHLVVVDAAGHAVGVVSSLDVIRGLIGRPAPHPDAFPHFDARTGVVWSNDVQLGFSALTEVPASAGLFVLIEAAPGRPNRVVWSEGTDDLAHRLRTLLSTPAAAPAHLVDAALSGRLWFRWAATGAHALPARS